MACVACCAAVFLRNVGTVLAEMTTPWTAETEDQLAAMLSRCGVSPVNSEFFMQHRVRQCEMAVALKTWAAYQAFGDTYDPATVQQWVTDEIADVQPVPEESVWLRLNETDSVLEQM